MFYKILVFSIWLFSTPVFWDPFTVCPFEPDYNKDKAKEDEAYTDTENVPAEDKRNDIGPAPAPNENIKPSIIQNQNSGYDLTFGFSG